MAEQGSWILEKEEKNRICERLMNLIVHELQKFIEANGNEWERELLTIQQKVKDEERRKEEERATRMQTGCRFQCLNCSATICRAEDIRAIKNDHHVIIDADANTRIRRVRGPATYTEPEGAEYGGDIYCMTQSCQSRLGSLCNYEHTLFPLMILDNVRIVNADGKGSTYKKWKQVPCDIGEFTFVDLKAVAERMREEAD